MKRFCKYLICLLALLLMAGCVHRDQYDTGKPFSRVLLLYTAGYNNLSSDIENNIKEICTTQMPLQDGSRALLVFSHQAKTDYDYNTPVQPSLVRLSLDWQGQVLRDTVLTFDSSVSATDPDTFAQVMEFVRTHYESDHYGLIMSSHGTGWMPTGYYDHPGSPDYAAFSRKRVFSPTERVAAFSEDEPKVRSFGAEVTWAGSSTVSEEMDILSMVKAIPMHLDYMLFDACLMGGIEIAFELRDKVDKIGFSQAEILAHGFPYATISERLLQGATDVEGFCSDYYEYYAAQQGSQCSATISVVDCHKLEEFAVTCKGLFSRYAAAMAGIDPKQVQGYFRKNRHWFYDLKDILEKAGASEADLNTLQQALDEVVTFKASTRRILDSFDVNAHCGLSMYLPADGDQYLDNYYKKFAWNQATGLVK